MAKPSVFDVVVIGSGSAGFSAVEAAVAQGARVGLIEKDRLGGECPNYACIPSKSLLKSASIFRTLGTVREFGIESKGKNFEWKHIMAYRQRVVETITGGGTGERYQNILKHLHVMYKKGHARFVDPHTIDVGGEHLTAKTFVIATGTVDFIPPIEGLQDVRVWSWKEAFAASRQPKSMAIIGGGPVACEMATFYASFGTRVIILQSAPVVLHREDEEISKRAQQALETLGVEVIVDAQILSCMNGGMGTIGVKTMVRNQERMFAVETVALAAGKRPNFMDIDLERSHLRLSHGLLRTNHEQRTLQSHIFAAGDVDGGLMFTHTAHYEGWVAGHNAALVALKKNRGYLKTDERVVPRATFIEPEVASVGITQAEVSAKYGKVLVGRYHVGELGRAVTDGMTKGFVKLVAHPKTRKLLGAHLICPHAGEIIHEAAFGMYVGATIDKLAGMIHAFPTYAEGLKAAASVAKIE